MSRRLRIAAPASALVLATLACNGDEDRLPAHRIRPNDHEMQAAEQAARAQLSYFLDSFAKKPEGDRDWRFRAHFEDLVDGKTISEDLWLKLTERDGDVLYGQVLNRPARLRHLASKTRVGVPTEAVTDWSFLRRYQLEGGYTLRVIYGRMNDEERRVYSQALPAPFARLPDETEVR